MTQTPAPAPAPAELSTPARLTTTRNPWTLTLWLASALGTLFGAVMVMSGVDLAVSGDDPTGGTVMASLGDPLLTVSLVGLVAAAVLSARAFERARSASS